MPWTAKDALRHTKKADTPEKRQRWAEVANDRLEACLERIEGTPSDAQRTRCEGSAIRQANSVVARMGEQEIEEVCVCPDCGQQTSKRRGIPCASMACSECGAQIKAGIAQEEGTVSDMTFVIDGEVVTYDVLIAAYHEAAASREELQKAAQARAGRYGIAFKGTERGANLTPPKGYPTSASEYGDPVNYKYPADAGHARPALTRFNDSTNRTKGGYSTEEWGKIGRRLARLITRHLKGSYKYSDGKLVQKDQAEADVELEEHASDRPLFVPVGVTSFADLRASQEVQVAVDNIRRYTYEFREIVWNIMVSHEVKDKPAAIRAVSEEFAQLVETEMSAQASESQVAEAGSVEGEIVDLSESAAGAILDLEEAETSPTSGDRAPLRIRLRLIEPGFGNEQDNHYYSREMLEECAHVFEGAKMYATDHRAGEKSVRTEVSVIEECPVGFTETGAPIAVAAIFDPGFAEATRNRARIGQLHTLESSILARGRVRPGEIDGREANVVESITEAIAVDWVTKAGAGGQALDLAESDGGSEMKGQTNEEERVPGQEAPPEPEEEAPKTEGEGEEEAKPEGETPTTETSEAFLSEAQVKGILGNTRLPTASQQRLAAGRYQSADQLQEAIQAETVYVKAVTGSGMPTGHGVRQDQPGPDLKQIEEAKNAVNLKWGFGAQRSAAE